jgi:hypothetical protein
MATQPKFVSSVKQVTIFYQGSGTPWVDQDPIEVSKDLGETVQWSFSGTGTNWVVCFKGNSPFQNGRHFFAGHANSGNVASYVQKGTTYNYGVEVDGHMVDPTVIIK